MEPQPDFKVPRPLSQGFKFNMKIEPKKVVPKMNAFSKFSKPFKKQNDQEKKP